MLFMLRIFHGILPIMLKVQLFLYARSETSDVLWYGVRLLATSCPLNICDSHGTL